MGAAWSSPAAVAVEDRLFRALAVLRVVVLINAVALNLYRADNFQRPVAGVVCVAIMIVWTGVAIWAYAEPRRRSFGLLVLDLAVAAAMILVSPIIKGDGLNASVPGFWVMGALLAWAIHFRLPGGLVAATCLSAADLSIRQEITQSNYGNVFLLMIGGPIVGFMCESLQRMASERDRAERATAAAAERARLARAVHDGVLQVLALVQRRGRELGGEAADLGRLAGEQESALRRLIRQQDTVTAPGSSTMVDLAIELSRLEAAAGASVAIPGTPVWLPATTAHELVAVAKACLDNVAVHVGPGAATWVLLEAFPDRVELSIRDEGPGIPDGRLGEAASQGRLGVSESIRGRIADLGGTAELATGSFGTEWEFMVTREPFVRRP